MRLYYDIHIHSAASHCADKNMRPDAIARAAKKNGLDVISVVDHVCGINMIAAAKAAKKHGLLFLPGMEITTSDGIHMLCYFKLLDDAKRFADDIYDNLPSEKDEAKKWGPQYIVDENDNITGEVEKGLFQFTSYDVWELIGLIESYDGLIIPAHINRDVHSLLMFYDDIYAFNFATVKLRKSFPIDQSKIKKTKVVYNSDAHELSNIAEAENYFEVKEKSVEAIFDYLKT